MIIPKFWAEAQVHHDDGKREMRAHRYGWSDHSQQDAQQHADTRARAALDEMLRGQTLPPREPKVPYNGGAGLPIREEIVAEHGDTILTRNSYGAICLNSPHVLFVDVDEPTQPPITWVNGILGILLCVAAGGAYLLKSSLLLLPFGLVSLLISFPLAKRIFHTWQNFQGGTIQILLRHLSQFSDAHPTWNLVVYQTPAGLRVLVTHRLFQPLEHEVTDCFNEMGADPVYVLMCKNQQCFRARLTPKPWRIGMVERLRPRPGVWPVRDTYREIRQAWIHRYTDQSSGYASCRYLTSLGSGECHPRVREVQQLHDEWSRAHSGQPIA